MHNRRNRENNSPVSRLTQALTCPIRLWALNTLSIIFKTLSLIQLYIRKSHCKHFENTFIISIDNISFGGTGKTPLVMVIAEQLEQKQIPYSIITRGYKSKYEKRGIKVESSHTFEDIGDEACLFKNRFPSADIYIGKNRIESIERALLAGDSKFRVILLDDGFQSSYIQKDVKIMLYNPQHPYFYLRHFKWLMKEEDYVLFYEEPDSNSSNDSHKEINATNNNSASVCFGKYYFENNHFVNNKGQNVDIQPNLHRFIGFSALGDNSRFERNLQKFNLVEYFPFPDHYVFTKKDIDNLENARILQGADYLVCTEKDFIKIKTLNISQIPLIYIKNSIKFNIDLIGKLLRIALERYKKNLQVPA